MTRILYDRHRMLRLSNAAGFEEREEEEAALPFSDAGAAAAFLRRLLPDPRNRTALRTLLAGEGACLTRRSDRDVLLPLARRLAAGSLRLSPLAPLLAGSWGDGAGAAGQRGDGAGATGTDAPSGGSGAGGRRPGGPGTGGDGGGAAHPAPPSPPGPSVPAPAADWIGFQLLDDETGEPVPGVELRLRLPDGTTGGFTTGSDGAIRLTALPAGTAALHRMLDAEGFEVLGLE